MLFFGINIGGTKCSVSLGELKNDTILLLKQGESRPTKNYNPQQMLNLLLDDLKNLDVPFDKISSIGISCGGPLNSEKGIILSPPNLPGWDELYIVDFFEQNTSIKTWLCNDANASALAEWKLGAGKGYKNMIFLTFGTGIGAGLILDGKLYQGTSDMAGEVGHIRITDFGPSGYGKMGSFEGYCSGGGIAQLASTMILEEIQQGKKPSLCPTEENLNNITAEAVGIAAKNGDKLALKILSVVGEQLGKGLSILIDILNPQCIVIGSIFARCYDEIWPYAEEVIKKETLNASRKDCKVVPCGLRENIGDMAALATADYFFTINQ